MNLTDDKFNGDINGINRRCLLNELLRGRYKFETPLSRAIRKIKKAAFFIALGILLSLSCFAIGQHIGLNQGYDNAVRAIYTGDKHDVEKKKSEAYRELDKKIAGAGDEGYRKIWK